MFGLLSLLFQTEKFRFVLQYDLIYFLSCYFRLVRMFTQSLTVSFSEANDHKKTNKPNCFLLVTFLYKAPRTLPH